MDTKTAIQAILALGLPQDKTAELIGNLTTAAIAAGAPAGTGTPAIPSVLTPITPYVQPALTPGEPVWNAVQTGHVLPLCRWNSGEGPGGYLLRCSAFLRPDLPADQALQMATNTEMAFMTAVSTCPESLYPKGAGMDLKIPIAADWFMNRRAYMTDAEKAADDAAHQAWNQWAITAQQQNQQQPPAPPVGGNGGEQPL